MDKLKRLFSRAEFHIFFACLCLVVFSWPFVSMSGSSRHPADAVFLYLFLPWGIVIVLLFLMSRSYDAAPSPEDEHEQEER
jgi:TRAP-type C4-dicarboxylate transport system permease small subunit